jgi:hypothetical protein
VAFGRWKRKELKTLIASIYHNADGTFGFNPSTLAAGAASSQVNFARGSIVINAGAGVDGAELGQQFIDPTRARR